ncbi:5627_t:CDS:1, partial [Gigaspora margarita]
LSVIMNDRRFNNGPHIGYMIDLISPGSDLLYVKPNPCLIQPNPG